tara:strand:+ start:352 stop:1119 length:768 start_codon:yes stop_codon:yes gene_type:complete
MKKVKTLNDHELEKFSRQIILEKIGETGQLKIINSSILIVGCGGLGTSAATYLSMSGILNFGLVDFDKVTLSNLNRQLMYTENDIGKKKINVLGKKLKEINSKIQIEFFDTKFNKKNSQEILKNYKIVLDCTDNFPTRYEINRTCYLNKKILISSALYNYEVQLFAFKAWSNKNLPCYNCIFPQNKKDIPYGNCNDQGIISSVAGIGGLLQANMVLNIVTNARDDKFKEFVIFNCESNKSTNIKVKKDKRCKICR